MLGSRRVRISTIAAVCGFSLFSAAAAPLSEDEMADALYQAHASDQAMAMSDFITAPKLFMRINALKDKKGAAARAERTAKETLLRQRFSEISRFYKLEISAFQQALTQVAARADGKAILDAYLSGHVRAALARLVPDAAKADTATLRAASVLAMEAIGTDGTDAAAVIPRFLALTARGDASYADWMELSRLYLNTSQYALAETAAMRAKSVAGDADQTALAWLFLGIARGDGGETSGAIKALEKDLAFARAQLAARPDYTAALWRRLLALENLGYIRRNTGDWDGADRAFQEDVAIRRKLAGAYPDRLADQQNVPLALQLLGGTRQQAKKPAEALAPLAESITLARALYTAHPDVIELQSTLLIGLMDDAEALEACDKTAEAVQVLREAADVGGAHAAQFPKLAGAQNNYAVALMDLGEALMKTTDYAGARDIYLRAEGTEGAAQMLAPKSTDLQKTGISIADDLGEAYEKLEDAAGAIKAYQKGLRQARALMAAHPEDHDGPRLMLVETASLAEIDHSGVTMADLLHQMEVMQKTGQLPENMRPALKQLKKALAPAQKS